MNPHTLLEARSWLAEIFPHDEDDIMDAPDALILRNIHTHYDGGIPAFIQDIEPVTPIPE